MLIKLDEQLPRRLVSVLSALGHSGAGKSTLLKLMAAIEQPSAP